MLFRKGYFAKFESIFQENIHCIKSVHIQSYSGPYFPAFSRIRTKYGEIRSTSPYGVLIRSISLYSVPTRENAGKMRTRITPNMDSFYAVIYSDLVFSRAMCFFETSTWSNAFFQRYWDNSPFQLEPTILWYLFDSRHVYVERQFVIWQRQLQP